MIEMNCQQKVEWIAKKGPAVGIDPIPGSAPAILKTDINPGW